jgi:hypothetical protein
LGLWASRRAALDAARIMARLSNQEWVP